MTQRDYEGTKKIVLMGLDNSGKTSITLSLMGLKNIPSFCSLKPTKQFFINKFKMLETEFSIWDFGGQEEFRKDYLTNFETYIKGTDKFIYIIDIQDTKRYDQALEYLDSIVNLLEKDNSSVDFSIFLHKNDPDLSITNKELTEEIIDKLVSNLKEIIPTTFKYKLFKTSIYTIFQKSKV